MDRRELNLTALISGVVFIVLGSLFLLERLAVITVSAGFVLPVLLVGLGLGILLGGRQGRRPREEAPPEVTRERVAPPEVTTERVAPSEPAPSDADTERVEEPPPPPRTPD